MSKRKLQSWITAFIKHTEGLHSPDIWRRWVAISTIAAVLEQKVWIWTYSPVYPNLYTFIIGHPGTGKTRTIREGRKYFNQITGLHLAPISLTWASLVDSLAEAKHLVNPMGNVMEFNSMYICADEMGAFIHKYDNEMTKGLSTLYDPDPYSQRRRTNDLNIVIPSPQINLITGVTPQDLIGFMPDTAWGQGFAARLIMVFSDERIIGDDFVPNNADHSVDLTHDLGLINELTGQFYITDDWHQCVNNWRHLGEPPVPNHPKLTHYITRRHTHLYKLSMISSIDRDGGLALTKDDFNQSLGWLLEAELAMPDIFKAGATNIDGQAIDEISHFVMVQDRGIGVSEQAITHFARSRVPLHSILRIVEIMERSGMIRCVRIDKRSGLRYFSAPSV
ncbi:MAG: DUF3987 domain-containing protein [Candidatus Saccharimonadales bacterium]